VIEFASGMPEPSRDPQWHQPTNLHVAYGGKVGLNAAQTILAATARLMGVTLRQGAVQPK